MRKAAIVPPSTVRYYLAGEHCTDPQLGDMVLVATDDKPAVIIKFGERLRLHGEDKIFAAVNHGMTVVDAGSVPKVQEMVGKGGVITDLENYRDLAYAVVNVTGATMLQREMAATAALWFVDISYGWPSILSDAIYCLTGLPFGLTIGQSVVCSADACAAQRPLGLVPDKPDVAVMPSDLARMYDVRLPL